MSWDPVNPADYLMAGWWAEFPGQHPPELSFADYTGSTIVDGPEIDPANPPQLPVDGTASYVGHQAGGLYAYIPRGDREAFTLDEYEGIVTLTGDFGASTIGGCIGCVGDLVTRRAHFGLFLGQDVHDTEAQATGYELHLGETSINPDGTFENHAVRIRHPEREIADSLGRWGGRLSSVPDRAGIPRLSAGFSSAGFEESDGSVGSFVGIFVALGDNGG